MKASPDYVDANVFSTESYRARRASNISILSPSVASSTTQLNNSQFSPERDTKSGQSYAQLRCQVKRNDVKVNWLRDESEISSESEKYRVLENGRERILVVQDVHDDDAGEFFTLSTSC